MKIACRYLFVAAMFLSPILASAQTPPRDKAPAASASSGNQDVAAIATGWTALAQGRVDDAVRAADLVLARRMSDHRAVDLKIEALSSNQPVRGLDVYEGWLTRTRTEDLFLLIPVAKGTLEQIAQGSDTALRLLALERLARAGDSQAAARMTELNKAASGVNDAQLALEGDTQAATRLTNEKTAATVPPQLLAKALPQAGAAAVPMLRALLKHPAAPVRMDAAIGLGKIGAAEAIPDLKALMADPEVRSYAAVALVRLGDTEAEPLVQEMLQSSVSDMRVLGAQAYEGKGPGPWVAALMPALQDPNGLTRIRAAELLAPVAPESARPVLLEAANDPNPVVRADVLRVMERTERLSSSSVDPADPSTTTTVGNPTDLPTLRRLLRDPDATIRLHAAGTLLALAKTRG